MANSTWIFTNARCKCIENTSRPKAGASLHGARLNIVHTENDLICCDGRKNDSIKPVPLHQVHLYSFTGRPFHLISMEVVIKTVSWFGIAHIKCCLIQIQGGEWAEVQTRRILFDADVLVEIGVVFIATRQH